jgi:hypothetical protein
MTTAVEQFIEQLEAQGESWENVSIGRIQISINVEDYLKLIEQAKEMEKQAHKETWDVAHQAGRFEGKGIAEENWQTFEGYWEENFKQQEQ